MIAIAWIILAWAAGWRWFGRLIGDPGRLLVSLASSQSLPLLESSPWPAFIFRLGASLWLGLLPLTWLTFGFAAALSSLLPQSIHPLLPVNVLVIVTLLVWLIQPYLRQITGRLSQAARPDWRYGLPRRLGHSGPPEPARSCHSAWIRMIRSLQQPDARFYLLTALIWLALALFLMAGTFYRDGTLYRAGYSVFSDFAPHTALVSSFSQGRNWPVEYPHFANDGIAYHFLFYFLCGNLNYLGLPLDWAINLPSILGLMTFCLLLGTLALCLTARRATFLLAPLLLFCRSSLAFFTYLSGLAGVYGAGPSAWPDILRAMLKQDVYIGNTAHDSWGLWGVNVYANQRHLLPGLSVALIVLFLLLPDLRRGLKLRLASPGWKSFLTNRDFWLGSKDPEWRRRATAFILCLMLPYFHGSALVSLLLMLGFIGIFSSNRLFLLILEAGSVLAASLQSRLFAGQAVRVIQPEILIGFLAPDQSLAGILAYLLEMSGLLLPLLLIAYWLPDRKRKVLLAAFMLPLCFALIVSLTPDVTVNHKYIMISFAFGNIYIADLLVRLWHLPFRRRQSAGTDTGNQRAGTDGWLSRLPKLAAVLLTLVLTITGLQELIILKNISKKTVAIDSASPLIGWISQNTLPDAVFVTAPYHYNAFFLSGRSVWLGHAYYAWSAGHDTAGRLVQEQWLIAGGNGDLAAVRQLIVSAGLDYLLLDDALRTHDQFTVNESFFDRHFPVAAEFPALGNLKIYDLRRTPGSG
ncbi:MAG TPA: hypothetical protein DD640_05805 [Clostridiales bacterium]|nr:hypothetical protein [Clostridiales bacterium]